MVYRVIMRWVEKDDNIIQITNGIGYGILITILLSYVYWWV